MCKILFLLPNLVAFSCYTVNIHLEKWSMRCDTKRAIWWDLYNKHISIFCIKHMSTIFRTLQVNKWLSKNETFFSFCEINATKFGTKNEISHKIIMQWKKSYYIATNVSSRISATTFGDLPDCWTPGFNILRKENCKPRRVASGFWDLVSLISEILRYISNSGSCEAICMTTRMNSPTHYFNLASI